MKPKPLLMVLGVLVAFTLSARVAAEEQEKELSVKQRIYHFEHRLLPKWTHGSKGAFFDDLAKGTPGRLVEAATDIVGKEFADQITVRSVSGTSQILIQF